MLRLCCHEMQHHSSEECVHHITQHYIPEVAPLMLFTMRTINLHSTSCYESTFFLFSGLQSLLYCESNTGNGFMGVTDGGQQSVDDNQWSYTSYYIYNQSSSLHKCGARPFVCTRTRQNSAGRYGLYLISSFIIFHCILQIWNKSII